MQLWQAISYPFSIKNRQPIFIGTILLLIPIIGWFIWAGYGLRLIRQLMQDKRENLPHFSFGSDFIKGLAVSLSALAYVLPVFVLAFLGGFLIGTFFGLNEFLLNLLNIALLLVYVLAYCAMVVGRVRAAAEDAIGNAYAVPTNLQLAFEKFGWLFGWALFQVMFYIAFIVLLLNFQYIALFLANWIGGVLLWAILGLMLIVFAYIYVLMSLSTIDLDAQLAKGLELTPFVPNKEKRS